MGKEKYIKIVMLFIIILFVVLFGKLSNVYANNNEDYKQGSGTEEDPYVISTPKELYAINKHMDACFILNNDIDLTYDTTNPNGLFYNNGEGWHSIGSERDETFSGILNGNNKKIKGLTQKCTANFNNDSKTIYGGLFESVSGEIKNIELDNISIVFKENENYKISANAGGISYFLTGVIDNIIVSGCIEANLESGYVIGGIVGTIEGGKILNSTNEINITCNSNNYGEVAGIAANIYSGQVINNINRGNIKGNQTAGGISNITSNQLPEIVKIINCINYGTITADYAGGIISILAGNAIISLSANYGIINTNSLGGGIAALVIFSGDTNGYIEQSFNVGTINTYGSAGGIVGDSVYEIRDCYNIGIINVLGKEASNIGGIAGRTGTSSGYNNVSNLINTYSLCNIISLNPHAVIGEIVGNSNSNINNSYYFSKSIYQSVGIQNDQYVTGNGIDESIPLDIEKLKNKLSFKGFDFDKVWNMENNSSYIFPELKNNKMEGKYATNIKISNVDTYVVAGGSKVKFNAILLPNDINISDVIWSIKCEDGIATITDDGVLTGVSVGKIKVKACYNKINAICEEREIIVKKDINDLKFDDISQVKYDGREKNIAITIKDNNYTLIKNKDYIISYKNNINVGTATVTISGTGNYIGTIEKTFKITPANIENSKIETIAVQSYTGKEIKPEIVVKIGEKVLTKNKDYTISYKNNINVGTATATIIGKENYLGSKSISFIIKKFNILTYRTHVENVGWQNYVSSGKMSGTVGQSLRLEGINIMLSNQEYTGNIEYRTHIQNIGWESNWKKNNEMSGTSGMSLRLEAIQIKLTGKISEYYDIYYRVHAQNFGWLGWAKNGEAAGTAGYSYRLEGIEIILVKKGEKVLDNVIRPYIQKYIGYRTHVENDGWQDYVYDKEMSGTMGRSLRLEGINIMLSNQEYTGNVEYRTHIQNIGWESKWKKNNEMSGTVGQSLRLEAIQIKLTGKISEYYDIYYRVHAQNFGWLGWAKNGEAAGTAGYSYRLEGIQIVLVKKGESTPRKCTEQISSEINNKNAL